MWYYDDKNDKYVNEAAPNKFEWFLLGIQTIVNYVLGEGCGRECGWEEAFEQFVPECGCPVHDSEHWWHKPTIYILQKFTGNYSKYMKEVLTPEDY